MTGTRCEMGTRRLRSTAMIASAVSLVALVEVASCSLLQKRPAVHRVSIVVDEVSVIWQQSLPPLAYGLPAADANHLYVYEADEATLVALDGRNGDVSWRQRLSGPQTGVRRLLSDENTLFSLTSTNLTAYERSTGDFVWSTPLGDGHVPVTADLGNERLVVYYGDSLILVSKAGQVIETRPMGNLLWLFSNTEIRNADGGMIGIDASTGTVLWQSPSYPFDVDEERPPIRIGTSDLLVYVESEGLCALDVRTGENHWCGKEKYISNPVFDPSRTVVYVLNEEFDLTSIDARTGTSRVMASLQAADTGTDAIQPDYQFSLTFHNDVLYVYLGDADQLIALGFE